MKRKIGYIISVALLVLFAVLTAALHFRSGNTVWALLWMSAALITAWGTTVYNIKISRTSEERLPYILLMIPLTCGMFGLLLIIVFALSGSIELPLY